jgi:hypothetical protein
VIVVADSAFSALKFIATVALLHGSLAELAEGGWGAIGCWLHSDPDPAMPFKANLSRRHHIPRQKRRVTNWAAYDASLRQRGSVNHTVRLPRGDVVGGPVCQFAQLARNVVTAILVQFEWQGRHLRLETRRSHAV